MSIRTPTTLSTLSFGNSPSQLPMPSTSPTRQQASFQAHPQSQWLETQISQSMPSAGQICETSQNSPRTSRDPQQSCWSRTIAPPRTSFRRQMLLFQKTLIARRRISGPMPAMAKRSSLSQGSMSEQRLPMLLTRSLSFEILRLHTGTSLFCIEPTRFHLPWKRSSRASEFLMRLSGDSSSMSVKKSKTPWLI